MFDRVFQQVMFDSARICAWQENYRMTCFQCFLLGHFGKWRLLFGVFRQVVFASARICVRQENII